MKVNRKELIEALNRVKPALATQDFIPVMRHFCFTGSRLYAYNEVNAIAVDFESPLKAAVPESLLPIASSYQSNDLTLLHEESVLTIKASARTKSSLPTLPSTEFLYKAPRKCSEIMEVDEDLLNGLTLCLTNVGENALRPSLMGVTLSPDRNGCLYSTDNLTMSRYSLKQRLELDKPIILPRFFCQQLTAWRPEGAIDLARTDSQVVARCEGQPFLVSHMLQGEPEDFATVIKRLYKVSDKDGFTFPPEDFGGAVGRSLVVKAAEAEKDITIKVNGNKLSVSAESQRGNVADRFLLERQYPELSLTVKGELLTRALGMCDEVNFLKDILALRKGTRFLHLISLLAEES